MILAILRRNQFDIIICTDTVIGKAMTFMKLTLPRANGSDSVCRAGSVAKGAHSIDQAFQEKSNSKTSAKRTENTWQQLEGVSAKPKAPGTISVPFSYLHH
ncbi:hypothetical protein Y1Q_0004866 [Alligator mississippiensis]|uniref:Uncharacterized protein n=1 Tax=Alligator mississippiensis TaxID=8496 RepID=A0A151NR25_ALLMI|nr:hypothetical protein Y1Q_0004866 [Alligator mississippiensis]